MQSSGAKRTAPAGGTSGTPDGDRRRVARRRTAREAAEHAERAEPTGPPEASDAGTGEPDGPDGAGGTDGGGAPRSDTASRRAGARRRTARRAGESDTPEADTPGPGVAVPAGSDDSPDLPVRPGEDPWTAEEVRTTRTALREEADALRSEIAAGEEALSGLMRDSTDTAGDDEVDTGTRNITREHEMAIVGNAREMLDQTERALRRLDEGTHGRCERCGEPIGKARMLAFPRATLCVECKQRAERHP
ncbi:hypothetical protein FNQ90_00355 [Streptomyces alkaliphilus]|uniref:Zinc finger DksA/TraR C4-type domain-containing protein n=1 Tax=Streptomyces alkaliphilus TaxID=1472722 RepID=A0A7W3T9A8_9ACTN|nr:TraR/DksA family transcriptional regulator [Streptomyces alkaliphilus]MBB0242596.1 hypothetical protein [Streptomyces alkaliphilus]